MSTFRIGSVLTGRARLYKKMKVGEQLASCRAEEREGQRSDTLTDKWPAKMQLTDWKEKKKIFKRNAAEGPLITSVLHEPDLPILTNHFQLIGEC
jgi:ABC-type uncharacterized transport system ATPase subunit